MPVHFTALWQMARPLIMLSVLLVYISGLLIARADGYPLRWEAIAWGLPALLLVSISIHYTNEYADVATDALTRPTHYSGGSGFLPRGLVSPRFALQAAWVSLLLGLGIAFLGYVQGSLPAAVLLCLGIGALGGWMYSLPPLKLAWRGWGELDNALLGGLLLHGYAYLSMGGNLDGRFMVLCLPFTLLTFNNLLATTWADREADAQVGKRTLATRLPRRALRGLYAAAVLLAYGLLLGGRGTIYPDVVVWASLVALPLLAWGWHTYTRIHAPYPTSNAMVLLLLAQMSAWASLAP